ncbi:MAG: hypothetical protein LBL52_03145 [Rickettsiales bacterium]|jgi:NTP pyrophosphatase (non-canonical NTP hydrolase)|nr:hypothetical protein [Rickettsiales bacterium]
MDKKLDFGTLIDFIKFENARLDKLHSFVSFKENVFAIMTKLMEESGELANEVFIKLGHCRPDKLKPEGNDDALAKELADNVIVLFLLADKLGIDIEWAIATKLEIIKKRDYAREGGKTYLGIVVQQSLENPAESLGLKILRTRASEDWTLLYIEVDEAGLGVVQAHLAHGWYAHFASGDDGVIIFKEKIFHVDVRDRRTFEEAVKYGKSVGIPEEQLDFPFEELACGEVC